MNANHSTVAIVMLCDDVAAICTIDRIEPAPWLHNLPARHPDRLLIEAKCLVARLYLTGDADSRYNDHECEHAARLLLEHETATPHPRRTSRHRRRLA